MSAFDTRAYWEDRLGTDWSLQSVGFKRMGQQFNDWAYRLREERFTSIVEEFLPEHRQARVLDVGSGTGFYIDLWQKLGVREVVSIELTDAGVQNLRRTFPGVEVVQNDISDGTGGLAPNSFDIVSIMDVMYHIVDAERFASAVHNLAALLAPGGHLLWSDFFIHGREVVNKHVAWRSIYRIEELLDQAGLEIVGRRPLFYLMNEPSDAPPIVLQLWRGGMWAVSQKEAVAGPVGKLLYHVDRKLCANRTESPSTEVMICRKRTS